MDTAVQPNVPAYLTSEILSDMMFVKELKEYFHSNVSSGIRTFQGQVVNAYGKKNGFQQENLSLLIYLLVIRSVLGTFIYDPYNILLQAWQTKGRIFLHDNFNIIVCIGAMFVSCLTKGNFIEML